MFMNQPAIAGQRHRDLIAEAAKEGLAREAENGQPRRRSARGKAGHRLIIIGLWLGGESAMKAAPDFQGRAQLVSSPWRP
jgi:hypothetical protein